MRTVLSSLLFASLLSAESLDETLSGFDDEPKLHPSPPIEHKNASRDDIMGGFDDEPSLSKKKKSISSAQDKNGKLRGVLGGFTGKLTEQVAYSYSGSTPHDNLSSVKSSLLLDYEHKFDNGFKFKSNAKAYYDAIYDIRGKEKYSDNELDELRSEVELYDAYIEGSIAKNLDIKLGRQVVVWGRSDTIRVTDVLNPLDNRRPGMVDIEDLRLPITMAKLDYFIDDWRITPMAIVEQRFSKNPPADSAFNPSPTALSHEDYSDVTPALSIGAEFSGWDINLYAAQIFDQDGYPNKGKMKHDKVDMLGGAVNILSGSWLIKSELAHFDKTVKQTKALLGTEYNGVPDTLISYDIAVDKREVVKEQYQHAFRVTSDFMNATIKANYLISLFGSKMDKGGFQRAWVKYDLADGIYTNIGVVDYISGSERFDTVANNDMIFMDVTYSF